MDAGVEALRIGLVLNPHARATRPGELRAQARGFAQVRVEQTRRVEDLPAALDRLLGEEGCGVLGIVGGDGSIHHAVNALLAGPHFRVPVLLLRGGGMNMLARALRVRGTPAGILRRFLGRHAQAEAGALPVIETGLLEVETERWGRRRGFIFGSALTARCLELHEGRFGGGYRGLARLLAAGLAGPVLRTRFWRQHASLLEAAPRPLLADGREMEYLAAVAATVSIELLGGWVSALRVPAGRREGLRVRILERIGPLGVLRRLPRLLAGRSSEGIVDLDGVRELSLDGDFSLDGEVYAGSGSLEPLRIRPSMERISIVRC